MLCSTTMCSTFAFPVWIGGSSLHICWGHYDVPLKWVTFRDPYIWVHFRQYVLKIRSGPIFCLLLGVSSDYAQPITGQVTKVTCPVIGRAQPELTPSKRQKMGPGDYAQFSPQPLVMWGTEWPKFNWVIQGKKIVSKQNRPPFYSWHNHDFHIYIFIHVAKQMHKISGKYLKKKYKISLKDIFSIPLYHFQSQFSIMGLSNAMLQYNTPSVMCILGLSEDLIYHTT